MKKAVIYARYSSDSQSEQSIEGQLRTCQQWAKNNNVIVVGTYIDRAMTGTNDSRPDFQRMIQDSYKQHWEIVLVYKLDRFSRNKYETTIHKHTLKENGVKVVSAMENIPDSPEGIILESLLEGMNQYYSAELSQKVNRGLKESYLKGNFTGGVVQYGYDIKDKKVIPNPHEAEIVKEIFTKFAQGYTGVDIAKTLQKRGIRTKKGISLNDKKVYKIIANTKYIGEVTFSGTLYTNIYPAIIDKETWNKVQSIRNINKHQPGRRKDISNYVLSGKLVCGYCKTRMVGESGKERNYVIKYRYYSCLTKRRKKGKCNLTPVRKEYLEDLVMKTTYETLSNDNNMTILVDGIYKYHEKQSKEDVVLKSLEAKRNECLKASNNLIKAVELGVVTEQTKQRLKELEIEIAGLDFDIENEKQRTYTYLTKELIEDYLNQIIKGEIDDPDIKKQIVKQFIREIVLYNDKLVIIYNFTEPANTKKVLPDNIEEINKLSKNTNSNFFYSREYFGVNKKL